MSKEKAKTEPVAAEKDLKVKEVIDAPKAKVEAVEKPKKAKAEEKPAEEKKLSVAGDPWKVLLYPSLSEKSIANVELQNKLVFIVKNGTDRANVKSAVEGAFNVKVDKVNITTTTKGNRKAYIRLSPEHSALDIATRLGMM